MYDVAIVGAGIAGMATAARLQSSGLRTVVLEAHTLPGGCAGFFRRSGFAFDVGATTLVDFEPGGIGGELLQSIGMESIDGEVLPGYVAWLPDRKVTLYRDAALWDRERLHAFGSGPAHRRLWSLFDRVATTFWSASRRGVRLPIRTLGDVLLGARALGVTALPLLRYVGSTMDDALLACGLRDDKPLRGLLSMLVEDTVHSSLEHAPFINGVLGATIRGAGLTRARGGMWGFWRRFSEHYRRLGGNLRLGTTVGSIRRCANGYITETSRGAFTSTQVVTAVPAQIVARIGPPEIGEVLHPHVDRNAHELGGAVVMFLGVPEREVSGQPFTHHQLLQDYDAPLGNGNNMFVSVSSAGDTASAPPGFRAVMVSTHCGLSPWEKLTDEQYQRNKKEIGAKLLEMARRVYPDLGRDAVVLEIATPRTYERFTRRPRGAVGGFRLTLANSNQRAIPHQLGLPGFWLCGDTTWPGLGTVACVLGSRIVAQGVLRGKASLALLPAVAPPVSAFDVG